MAILSRGEMSYSLISDSNICYILDIALFVIWLAVPRRETNRLESFESVLVYVP